MIQWWIQLILTVGPLLTHGLLLAGWLDSWLAGLLVLMLVAAERWLGGGWLVGCNWLAGWL